MSTQFTTLDSAHYINFAGPEAAEPTHAEASPDEPRPVNQGLLVEKTPADLAPAQEVDPIRVRLDDAARQEEKRRLLHEFLQRPNPAWNPADHPEIDAAGGAAAWVRKLRRETERGFKRRTRANKKG